MKRTLVFLLVMGCVACSTTPAPRVLSQAQEELQQAEAAEVDSRYPRLLNEARKAIRASQKAVQENDAARAEYHARIARSKIGAAQNLIRKEEASSQLQAMSEALDGLEAEEERLEREGEALQRFEELQGEFAEATAALERYSGLEGDARRALAQARTKQSEAIAVGGPTLAAKDYEKGRLLVESALTQLQERGFPESIDLSESAAAAFDQAASKSKDSDVALRRERRAQEEQSRQGQVRRQKALDAIDEAVAAKAVAVSEGGRDMKPGAFDKGELLLSRANTSLDAERWDAAMRDAEGAEKAYRDSVNFDSSLLASARNAVQNAEDARRSALGRGASTEGASMREADFSLDLARAALNGNEWERARDTAEEAARLYEAASEGRAAEPRVQERGGAYSNIYVGSQRGVERRSPRPDDGMKRLATERVLNVQMQRAEALGNEHDAQCPMLFREFEAVLEMANERLRGQDYANALEFAIRADERLKGCLTGESSESEAQTSPQALQQASPAPTLAPTPAPSTTQDTQTERVRSEASSAISRGLMRLARFDGQYPDEARLNEPRTLLERADTWFGRRAYEESKMLAERANQRLTELEPVLSAATREGQARQPRIEAASRVEAPAEEPREAPKVCRNLRPYKEQVESSRSRVLQRQLSGDRSRAFADASRVVDVGKNLEEEGRCEEAELMLRQAIRGFNALEPQEGTESRQQAVETPRPEATPRAGAQERSEQERSEQETTQQEITQQEMTRPPAGQDPAARVEATEAIAQARRARTGVDPNTSASALGVADSLLTEARTRFEQERYGEARVLAAQAAGAFSSLHRGPTQDTSEQWRPAYVAVLDALVERDRAKVVKSETTQQTFNQGVGFLERAQRTWNQRDFVATKRFADAALSEFEQVVTEESNKDDVESRRKAAELERQAAEREAEREAARAETQRSARLDASEALRLAELRKAECERADCKRRAPQMIDRANLLMRDARDRMGESNFDEAQALAGQAREVYGEALEVRPTFELKGSVSLEGDRVVIEPRVDFSTGSTQVTPQSLSGINELGSLLSDNAEGFRSLRIIGYTDSRGNANRNRELSQSRAQEVKRLLESRGVSSSKLVAIGRGEDDPIASNETAEGRAQNRRVEFVIELEPNTEVRR